MTPKERAQRVININSVVLLANGPMRLDDRLIYNIAEEITLAIAEERERFEKILLSKPAGTEALWVAADAIVALRALKEPR